MKKSILYFSVAVLISFLTNGCSKKATTEPTPYLTKNGSATQLMVGGKPYLILGGELHNSSSSSREYMKKFWPELKASGMNTVLAAVEWSLIEPQEGRYDFTIIDNMLQDARANDLRLILLWFGSWKNAQLHYIPDWMKEDFKRFPRVKADFGKSLEILSLFSKENLDADRKAFTEMMKHLKMVDSVTRTVIMVQVENEVGVLGSPRDHSGLAENAFNSAVPKELTDRLVKNRNNLLPELAETWKSTGYREAGTWEEVFGKGPKTDEIFMAWGYATYINSIAKAGKAVYNLPMFVNAWLVQEADKIPGDYPSGGPQAHMLDIWKAGAPEIDLFCPDIYRPVFSELCALYCRNNNTLFIPESRAGEQGAGQFFYAIGRHSAIGYSPFGFESRTKDIENDPMTRAYKIASEMAQVILEAQAKGAITAVLLDAERNPSEEITIGGYKLLTRLDAVRRSSGPSPYGYALIINSGENEFIIYGSNIQISFSPATPGPAIAGIAHCDEGTFENGVWVPGRRLNGDEIFLSLDLAGMAKQDKAGTGVKFNDYNTKIQKVKLYRYE